MTSKYKVNAPLGLNLRDLPELEGNVLGLLPYGTEVSVQAIHTHQGRDWAEIGGYVALDWLKKVDQPPPVQEYIVALDVSGNQKTIRWDRIREAGIDHVILRGPIGASGKDTWFDTYSRDSRLEGFKRSIYGLVKPQYTGRVQGIYHRLFFNDHEHEWRCAGDFEMANGLAPRGARPIVLEYFEQTGPVYLYSNLGYMGTYVGHLDIDAPLWIAHPEPQGIILPPELCKRPLPGGFHEWKGYQFTWTYPHNGWVQTVGLDASYFKKDSL